MARAQCVVLRGNRLLMTLHQQACKTWWCLPGGGVEQGETPGEAALRELREECCVEGKIIRQISYLHYLPDIEAYTYLITIGDQVPTIGADPEFPKHNQILIDIAWLSLEEIPERDRAFLWSAGLLTIPEFLEEVSSWGNDTSYPPSIDNSG